MKEINVIIDTLPKNELPWLSVPQNVLANHGANQCLNNYFTVYCSQVHIFKRRNDRVVLVTVSQRIITHSFSHCEYSSGNRTLCFIHKCSSTRHELTLKLSSLYQRRVYTNYLSISNYTIVFLRNFCPNVLHPHIHQNTLLSWIRIKIQFYEL